MGLRETERRANRKGIAIFVSDQLSLRGSQCLYTNPLFAMSEGERPADRCGFDAKHVLVSVAWQIREELAFGFPGIPNNDVRKTYCLDDQRALRFTQNE